MTPLLIALQLTVASFSVNDYSGNDYGWLFSDSNITSATRDSLGFLWVATKKELARFDGRTFLLMDDTVNSKLFADGNQVEKLQSISGEEMELYTAAGMYRFNIRTRQLVKSADAGDMHIHDAVKMDGYTLLNCSSGIWRYGPGVFERIFAYPDPANAARKIAVDSTGTVWTVASGDLIAIDDTRIDTLGHIGNFSKVYNDRFDNLHFISKRHIGSAPLRQLRSENMTLRRTQSEVTAIGEYGDALLLCRRGKGVSVRYRDGSGNYMEDKDFTLSKYVDDLSNTVNAIYTDDHGHIWLCTRNGLFCLKEEEGNKFARYIRSDINDPASLSHNTVSDILVEGRNTLWLGTAYGLDRLSFSSSAESPFRVEHFFAPKEVPDPVAANKMEQVEAGPDGRLWIGTKKSLEFADPKTGRIIPDHDFEAKFGNSSFVRSIYHDKNGNMWIGFDVGGVFRCGDGGRKVEKIRLHTSSGELERCVNITGDRSGNIWISGGKSGVFCLEKGDSARLREYALPVCHTIFADPYNTVWCGTSEGLYRYNHSSSSFKKIRLPFPANSEAVVGIINDDHGNLWVSGISGVCRYSPSEDTASFMVLNDGRFAREGFVFNQAKDSDGNIYLGGINGLTILNTERGFMDSRQYKCTFTEFEAGGGKDPEDSGDINFRSRVTLGHKGNKITFSFTAMPFDDSNTIQYSYRLDGKDRDWVYCGTQAHKITYTDIRTGKHRLDIRCTDAAGIWQDPSSLDIIVQPPVLLSWYCICLYLLTALAAALIIMQWLKVKTRLRTQEAVNRSRQKFFKEVSDDIKDPYTLLRTPLQKLIDEQDTLSGEEAQYLLDTVRLGSDKLALLVNQIVDYSEIDRGQDAMDMVLTDFIPYTEGVYESFRKTFRAKGITLSFDSSAPSFFVKMEKDKIDNVFFELLSYIYRNSSKGHTASIHCSTDGNGHLILTIRSDGNRLSREGTEHFFDVGLGLSLTREIISLHEGLISVGNHDDGIEFRLSLPEAKKHDAVTDKPDADRGHTPSLDTYIRTLAISNAPRTEARAGAPLLYLVIKDDQIRAFLENMFGSKMKVRTFKAPDGVYEAALQDKPEVIISGIMFSRERRGLDLCRMVKESVALNRTAFVVLTSSSSDNAEREAYKAGADAFLSKPFDMDCLIIRVEKLLKSREEMISTAKKELISTPREVKAVSADEKFLTDAMKVIEKNMDNEEFGVGDFSRQMNLSSSMLYRKMKALTGKSPNEFLREVRMKRAAQLLETNAYTVSEVAYMVGFIDMHYFSTCFKKAFGKTPSEYRQTGRQA